VLANSASTAAIIAGDAAPSWLEERGFHSRLIRHDGASVYVNGWPRPKTGEEGRA
jgi:thiamine biosynthesis lipoprotein